MMPAKISRPDAVADAGLGDALAHAHGDRGAGGQAEADGRKPRKPLVALARRPDGEGEGLNEGGRPTVT